MSFPRVTPDEAAALVEHGQTVGFSGFTPAGAAKLVPLRWRTAPERNTTQGDRSPCA